MAYRKNTDYERQRKDREKYILPDDLIKEFWKTNLKKLIVETESVIYAYSNFYVNKELSYEDLRKKARDAYSKLKDVYRTVVEVWFPLTDSDLKDYSKQSYDLAIDIFASYLIRRKELWRFRRPVERKRSAFVCQNIIQRTGILKYVAFKC